MAKLLVVNHEGSTCRALGELLRGQGHEAVTATDVASALRQLKEKPFDVVVADIGLSRLIGEQLLRSIRAADPRVQVVLLTDESSLERAGESLSTGAADYLLAPVTQQEVLRVVADAVRLKSRADTERLDTASRPPQEGPGRQVGEPTSRSRASKAKAQALWRFNQAVLDALTTHVCVLAEDGTILAANKAWKDFALANSLGSASAGVGANYLAVCERATGEDAACAREVARGLRSVIRGEVQEYVREYPCHSPREQRWFVMRATRFIGDGQACAVVAHFDITERRLAESALRESQANLARAESFSHIMVTQIGLDGRWLKVPPLFCRLLGYTEAELLDRRLQDVLHPDAAAADWAQYQMLVESDLKAFSSEKRFLHKRGQTLWLEVNTALAMDARGDADRFLTYLIDITERRESGERVRAQAALLDLTTDAIIVQDLEGRISYWNKAAEKLYGWAAGEAIGMQSSQWLFPAVGAPPPPCLEETRRTGRWSGELERFDRAGRKVTVDSRWTLMRDPATVPQSILIVETDITERKRTETLFLRSQRLESVGRLASGVAHDLNNILAPILMAVPLLRTEASSAPCRRLLNTIESSAQRGANVVKQILTFSRGIEGQKIPLQLQRVVKDMRKIILETFPRSISLEIKLAPDLWPVLADPTQLHQVLMNLCVNARDAMPRGGTLILEAENTRMKEGVRGLLGQAEAGAYVVLTVTDTGTGIPPEALDKIFDPFYTTKPIGQGSGLGLSTVLGIVRSHGGIVQVDSRVGYGSLFRVFLPATEGDPSVPVPEASDPPKGRNELILVIDDEELIRGATQATLEASGYRVQVATNGREGVAFYATNADHVSLVLLDLMMPIMDGATAIRVLRSINPDVRLIASSGLGSDPLTRDPATLGVDMYLDKPLGQARLLKAIREVLDRPPEPPQESP